MPWRGGKLVRLLGERFGANARVCCVATVRGGEAAVSRVEEKCDTSVAFARALSHRSTRTMFL